MIADCGREDRQLWTPRLSKAFADHLKKKNPTKGRGGYSDRTVNRILAYLKTFAKWIHKLIVIPGPAGYYSELIPLTCRILKTCIWLLKGGINHVEAERP